MAVASGVSTNIALKGIAAKEELTDVSTNGVLKHKFAARVHIDKLWDIEHKIVEDHQLLTPFQKCFKLVARDAHLQLLLIFEGNILSQSFLIKVFSDQQKSKENCQIGRCQKHQHRFILSTACDSTNDSSGDSELHCQNDKVAQILVDSSQPQHFNGGPLKPHVSF